MASAIGKLYGSRGCRIPEGVTRFGAEDPDTGCSPTVPFSRNTKPGGHGDLGFLPRDEESIVGVSGRFLPAWRSRVYRVH